MNNQNYVFKVYKQLDNELIGKWQTLWQKTLNGNFFNSYEFFKACLHSNPLMKYEIYTCFLNEELVAVLPLTVYRSFGIKVAGTLCNEFLIDTAFLIDIYNPKLIRLFFENIIKERSIYIHKIDAESAKILRGLFPDMYFTLTSANPYVDFTSDPLKSISKSTFSQIKRNFKNNLGLFNFKIFTGSDNLKVHFGTMIEIEQKSSKKQKSMDIFSKSHVRTFYYNLIKYCRNFIWICFLYYDNIPVAYNFGFIYKHSNVAYQTSFLSEYFKLRPGKTMLFQMIDYLKNKNINILDLGGGMSNYKLEFTSHYRLLYDMYYSKNKPIIIWWQTIHFVRRIKQIFFHIKNNNDYQYLFKTLS